MMKILKILSLITGFMLIIAVSPFTAQAAELMTLTAQGAEGYVHLQWSVDKQVYGIANYEIYRGTSSGFSTDKTSLLIQVYNPQAVSFDDYNASSKNSYFYVVKALNANGIELVASNEVSSQSTAKQPHGFYDNKTTKCSVCHSSHEGKANSLINTELNTAEDLCKICHETGGESKLSIAQSKASTDCNQCHNPHGNNKDKKFVPMLLQVTVNGQVYFQVDNPEKGVGNGFCMVPQCHSAYPDFKYEPPKAGEAHDSADLADKLGITCNACHETHGPNPKQLRKEISWQDNSYLFADGYNIFSGQTEPAIANYNGFCESCHEKNYKGWPGKTAFQSNVNQHQDVACYACHDPHGVGIDKYLKSTYAKEASDSSIDENFKLCFSSCHNGQAQHDSTLLTASDNITTKFALKTDLESINLHKYHLETLDSSKRAVCRDCHRPHGANEAENPAGYGNIGFPSSYNESTYLHAYGYDKPRFEYSSNSGSCDLICHGAKHTEVNSTYGTTQTITQTEPNPSQNTDNTTKENTYNTTNDNVYTQTEETSSSTNSTVSSATY